MAAPFDAPRVPPPLPRCSPTAVLPVVHPPRTGYKSLEYLVGYSRCPITASARRGRVHPLFSMSGCTATLCVWPRVFGGPCVFVRSSPVLRPCFPPTSFVINAKHRSFGLLPESRSPLYRMRPRRSQHRRLRASSAPIALAFLRELR